MALPAGWRLLILYRVAPSHRVRVKHVKVITWYDLFKRFSSSIVSSEQVDLVANQVGCVAAEALRRTTEDLWLSPGQSLSVEDVQVFEMFISRMPPKQVEFVPKNGHSVRISSHRDHTGDLRLNPSHCVQVQDVYVIKALVSVIASKHVQLSAYTAHSVAGAR